MKELTGEELGGLLFGIHIHAATEGGKYIIVYKEDDIIKLLTKLGYPAPVWGEHLEMDSFFKNK